MKLSLHFYFWLTAMAASLCAWPVYAANMDSWGGLLTVLVTMFVGLWGFVVFADRK